MREKYEYFNGVENVSVDELDTLAAIMNQTASDPDAVDREEAVRIARDVFKMDNRASVKACLEVWDNFLAIMYIRGIDSD